MTSVESRVEQVTVYASGARVRRIATIVAPGIVRMIGLPLAVIDDSISASLDGTAVVTAMRVVVDAPATTAAAEETSSELRTARGRLAVANAEVDRIDRALQTQPSIVATDDRHGAHDAPAAWNAIVAARRQLVALHAARELRLREQHAAAKRVAREAREAVAVVEDREARASSAREPKLHELRKAIELEVMGDGTATVRVEYRVAAARWAPSYVARLDGDRVGLEVRAVVAQETGEDWQNVALQLSTAEPEQFSALPELAVQRIGRRQDAVGKSGFRPPPQGGRALYADYEDAFPAAPPPPPKTQPRESNIVGEVWDDGSSNAKDAFLTPPSGQMMPPSPQAFVASGKKRGAMQEMAGAPVMATRMAYGGAAPNSPMAIMAPPPPPPPPEPTPRLDYTNLVMAPASSARRGALVPAPSDPQTAGIASSIAEAIERIARRALPPGCVADWTHTYDYAFASDGKVDVRADGAWHSLALTTRSGTAKIGHVAVPREQGDVFRVASIANPLAAPLLPGPIDVYDRGRFLVTSAVDYTPPGATVEVGLGVDPTVKIARNTEFREEATGMLRGALRLHHAISIDIENLSGKPIELEIRERIPVRREGDDEVEVTLGKIEPAWERWTPDPDAPREGRLRGAYRWRLALPVGAKKSVRAAYEVKIAGKLELVGGNRRES